jgi:hypothetical protein
MTPIVPVPRAPKPAVRPVDKLAPLRNHPLFREFPPTVIENLGTYMTRRSVRRAATAIAALTAKRFNKTSVSQNIYCTNPLREREFAEGEVP